MPGIRFSSAHWVAQYQQRERELLPAPDRPIWTHVVATLEPDSTHALAEASTGAADPLPGIHPDLRQYVAEADAFTAVPPKKADEILDVEHMIQDDPVIWLVQTHQQVRQGGDQCVHGNHSQCRWRSRQTGRVTPASRSGGRADRVAFT